ncbi:unnamed protein product [Rhizoctonia solani]|uniref:Uncharacterized protein n=1 Tax=Rhizoctonia solani TaxID=456999 RepID=A0A8H2XM31_9AGAM|nr:unnamed protein product [Rhizoctonia solani]
MEASDTIQVRCPEGTVLTEVNTETLESVLAVATHKHYPSEHHADGSCSLRVDRSWVLSQLRGPDKIPNSKLKQDNKTKKLEVQRTLPTRVDQKSEVPDPEEIVQMTKRMENLMHMYLDPNRGPKSARLERMQALLNEWTKNIEECANTSEVTDPKSPYRNSEPEDGVRGKNGKPDE